MRATRLVLAMSVLLGCSATQLAAAEVVCTFEDATSPPDISPSDPTVYVYRLNAGGFTAQRKFVLLP